MTLSAGSRLGPYGILSALGAGGMGEVYRAHDTKLGRDVALKVLPDLYDERDGQFSPDGKWIAYQSDESGRPEIYVQPFPGPGTKVRISTDGGTQARWRQDGTELFYVSPDNRLISVTVSNPEPGQFRVGRPVPLFQTRMAGTTAIARQQYVVASDGRRFLINTAEETATAPITLLLNWRPAAATRRND